MQNRNINMCTCEDYILQQLLKPVLNNKIANPKFNEIKEKLPIGITGGYYKYSGILNSDIQEKTKDFENSATIWQMCHCFQRHSPGRARKYSGNTQLLYGFLNDCCCCG